MATFRPNDRPTDMSGSDIYYDDKNRMICYEWVTKKAYYLGRNDYPAFSRYHLATPLAVLLPLVMLYVFKLPVWLCAVLALVILVAGKALLILNFLDNLTPVKDFVKPKKDNYIKRVAKQPSASTIIAGLVFTFLISILSFINVYTSTDYTPTILYLNYVVAVLAVLLFVVYVIAFFLRLKYRKAGLIEAVDAEKEKERLKSRKG